MAFFTTARGKDPCDGIGDTIKRMTRASLQRPSDCQITTLHELLEWASDPINLPNIIVQFSLTEEYNLAKEYLAT